MNKSTAIALKLFAMYWLVQLICSVPTLIMISQHMLEYQTGSEAFSSAAVRFYYIAPVVLTFIVGGIAIFVLWKVASTLEKKDASGENLAPQIDLDTLFTYALALMGLYFALTALLQLPQAVIAFQWEHEYQNVNSRGIHNSTVGLVVVVARFILGSVLMGRPRQWVRAIRAIGEK